MTRGFTLIELVVVVVIMAVVAAIAAPARSGATRDYRVRLLESRVSADLVAAQRASWHGSTQTKVTFTVATDNYRVRNGFAPEGDSLVSLANSPYRVTLQTVDFGDGVDGVIYIDGAPTVGASGQLGFSVSGQPFAASIDSAAGTMVSAPK